MAYGNGKYTAKAWRTTAAEEITLTHEIRPGCPGNWRQLGGDCLARPDHIVVYTVKESELPGAGTQYEYYACYRHVHSLLQHAERVGTFVTVSAYDGV